MFKRILIAVIVATLTTLGVVIPDRYIDGFVTFFVPSASASTVLTPWQATPYSFRCDWYCACPKPVAPLHKATVEALRPSSPHFSGDRNASVS